MKFDAGLYITGPRAPITDLDALPFPDRSQIDHEKYADYIGDAMVKNTFSLQTSRGCPYKCLYCHKIWPKKHYVRSAENIFEEIKQYYRLGVRRFSFFDDVFNLDIKNGTRFFRQVLKEGMDVHFFFPNGLRGDILTREYMDLMMEAGTINVSLALETASPRLQKLIGKNLNLGRFRENIEYIIDRYPQVILELETMHGFPTETEEEAVMTLEFIKSLQWLHFPYLNVLKIYPNTEMAKMAVENGVSPEAIQKSGTLGYHELPDTLPFDKQFSIRYQTEFFQDYFLNKERLIQVLNHQVKVATESEIVQKYDSYCPFDVKSLADILEFAAIDESELEQTGRKTEEEVALPGLNEALRRINPQKPPKEGALRVLLLDLSQYYSRETEMLYDVVEPPLGLMYLMTYLKKEMGPEVEGQIAKSRIDFDSMEELRERIEAFEPQVIGIRTLTMFREFFHRTVREIRDMGFEGPLITGGPYATSDYPAVLREQGVDLVVLGEGEITFTEVIKAIRENNGKLPPQEGLLKIRGIAYHPGRETEKEGLLDDFNDDLEDE